jgi:hypothetical protein
MPTGTPMGSEGFPMVENIRVGILGALHREPVELLSHQ